MSGLVETNTGSAALSEEQGLLEVMERFDGAHQGIWGMPRPWKCSGQATLPDRRQRSLPCRAALSTFPPLPNRCVLQPRHRGAQGLPGT